MTPIAQRLALAAQHHDAGRLQEAERLYRAVLQDSPQNPHALHLLGVLSHQLGKHQEAIEFIQKALSVHGPHPVFHSNLAAAYLAIDRLLEAAAHAQEAVRLQPDFANGHNNLGIAQRGLGQLDAAARAFREALRLQPEYVDALCNLGTVLHRQDKLAEAATVLREAIRLSPRYAQAHNNLGGVLLALNQFEAAAQHLNEAVRLKPDFANAHSNLGVALEHLNRIDDAIQCFRTSIRLDPDYAPAHNNLGSALKNLGKIDEALHEYKEVQRIDPDNGVALFNLSKLAGVGRYTFSAAELEHIQELTTRPNIAPDNRSRLHFALAQVHEKNGAYDEAFAHCRRANDLTKEVFRSRGSVFDPAAHARRIDQLIAAFTPAYFERVRGFGNGSELPIFIVGMPRSGSTLAEQILASHPQVHGAGELADIDRLFNAMTERIGKSVGYPKCLDKLDAATVQSFAAGYLQELKQLGGAAERVTDKAPFNFFHLGMLQTLYPRARIIHCRPRRGGYVPIVLFSELRGAVSVHAGSAAFGQFLSRV